MGLMNSTECRWKPKDIHMPHYGKSGYRWMVQEVEGFDPEVFIFDEEYIALMLDINFFADDEEKMISVILQNDLLHSNGQNLLLDACSVPALNCIMALVKGEAHVTVDVNLPSPAPTASFPIHEVAYNPKPSVIEFLLYSGAQPDARTLTCRRLPLHSALGCSICGDEVGEWNSMHSIFKLIILLCLPILQDKLESIALLAYTIEETEEEFLRLARYGRLKELATLLVAAYQRLGGEVMQRVRNSNHSLMRERRKQNLFLLLEVFDRAGDALEAYVKQEKYGVSIDQSVKEVACLLQEAGFHLKHKDTDLSIKCLEALNMTLCKCRSLSKDMRDCDCSRLPEDIHMSHYGKSGYRWTSYDNLRLACGVGDKEALNVNKLVVKPPNGLLNSSKYSCITNIHDRGVSIAIREFHSQIRVKAKVNNEVHGKTWIPLLDISSRRKPRALLASVIKGVLKGL